ncbi:MAG TPA: ParB/RepB/Spo0J family partition protein [Solirubrobacterales bacterium]|jgi:ParB/RepB/Spo0J family partition protein|nr:ParB/RepB/Spo0J family partition protein [Solirubrobacterales bacterium]
MNDLATPLLEVDKIEVVEGFNPRSHMDPDALARLAGSLGKTDVVQPLTVRPIDGGKFAVIAGHRRLKAAEMAGIKKVPVHVREGGDALTAALVENHHREDLDPIDTARGLQALAEELNLTTHKKIAEELEVSDSWVSHHLRLLKLPEAVQVYIAQGHVPVEAERELRGVAKVSPKIAECICELAKRRKIKGHEFVVSFGELFAATAEARFEDKPTMIDPSAVRLSDVIADPKKRRDLGDRHLAARPYTHTDNPTLKFGEAEVDAARAAGCLVEHQVDQGEWTSTVAFITDVEFAADLAERLVERIVKEEAERKKRDEEWRAQSQGREPLTPEKQKEERQVAYKERKEKAAEARTWNETVGGNLLKRRGGSSRKQFALARVKAMAIALITDNPTLAARGLRLVTSQLQEVEVKQLKTTSKTKEKVSYADAEQSTAYLVKRVKDASSVNEVAEIVGDAMVASLLADEDELPQSKQVRGGLRASAEVAKLLTADIKSVRPRRRRRKSGE